MGVQRGGTAQPNQSLNASGFSPRQRAKKVIEDFKAQLMSLAAGNIVEFNELMRGDVSLYLLKFEQFIKHQRKDGTSRS